MITAEIKFACNHFFAKKNGDFIIRWFGPEYEIPLCGHGTLAAGYVLLNVLEPALKEYDCSSKLLSMHSVFKTKFPTMTLIFRF